MWAIATVDMLLVHREATIPGYVKAKRILSIKGVANRFLLFHFYG
jgi:hypothetical protein